MQAAFVEGVNILEVEPQTDDVNAVCDYRVVITRFHSAEYARHGLNVDAAALELDCKVIKPREEWVAAVDFEDAETVMGILVRLKRPGESVNLYARFSEP